MRNMARLPWFMLVLAGMLLFPAMLIGALDVLPLMGAQTAHAANGASIANTNTNACVSASHLPLVGETLIVTPGELLCGDVTAVGGTITIHGELHGNILAYGSDIRIDGGVFGDITLFGGSITLISGCSMHGTAHLYGSQEMQQKGACLDQTIDNHSKPAWLFGPQGFSFPFWFLILMIPLGLLCTWILPEHVLFVRATVEQHAGRSLLVGLLSIILAPIITLLLFALIIAIPVALILLVVLFAAWVLGMIALSWLIGEQVIHALSSHPKMRHIRALAMILGLVVLAMFISLPVLGWLISLGASMIGLGAVLLSRFGTRPFGRLKHPLPLPM